MVVFHKEYGEFLGGELKCLRVLNPSCYNMKCYLTRHTGS